MNGLTAKFSEYIKKEQLFQQKDRLLIAVSGGIDSVVLCELCRQAGYDFVMAHCNFQLRGADSNADEDFVVALGEKYGVEVLVKKFDTAAYEQTNKLSTQVAARELRYNWFNELMHQEGKQVFNCLLTAHHANDNIETVLMNFFKGTGINGLQGILPKDKSMVPGLVRPLLFAKKEELVSFAAENGLAWREDLSNNSNIYTRNYFRNELIPSLQKVYPQVEENLLGNIGRFRDINILYRQTIDTLKKKLVFQKGSEFHVPVLKLLHTPSMPVVLYEIMKPFGFQSATLPEIMKLLKSESGKYMVSKEYRILRNRNWLIISPLTVTGTSCFVLEENNGIIDFGTGKISTTIFPGVQKINSDPHIAQLDASQICYPLLLRKWKQGDYFYPLGMEKKKKLSRFLIDQKLSIAQKENTWVLESGKKILWVVGMRIDNRFRVTPHTQSVIQFTLTPA